MSFDLSLAISFGVNQSKAARFYWVIIPRNFTGMTCSIFLATVGFIQTIRVVHYEQTLETADASLAKESK